MQLVRRHIPGKALAIFPPISLLLYVIFLDHLDESAMLYVRIPGRYTSRL